MGKKKVKPRKPVCPYCTVPAELVTGDKIYPNLPDLKDKLFWRCLPCMAWTGTHKGTKRALGRLSNLKLRRLKRRAHRAFDPLWERKIKMGFAKAFARNKAYEWLAGELGIEVDKCHIGHFDEEMCERVIAICEKYHP